MSTRLFNFEGIPEVLRLTWILGVGVFWADLILAEDLFKPWWPLSVASSLPFGDHSGISLCRLNEKKGFWTGCSKCCGMWKCMWKLPDTEFFGIVYTLCAPLSNSFRLLAHQKGNKIPFFLGLVLNIFLKLEMNRAILKSSYVYMCIPQPVFSKK